MITTFTITGADDSVDPADLFRLQHSYPFVEWGILMKDDPKHKHKPRYPSWDWLKKLANTNAWDIQIKPVDVTVKHVDTPNAPLITSTLKPINVSPDMTLNLSLHLCNDYVKDFVMGGFTRFFADMPYALMGKFRRIQLNGIEAHDMSEAFVDYLRKSPHMTYILQASHTEAGEAMARELWEQGVNNIAILLDASAGNGVHPQGWPEPVAGAICGYAGGLNYTTLLPAILDINDVTDTMEPSPQESRLPNWIDMETGARSGIEGKQFDLSKVRECLGIASPYIFNYL